MDAIPASFNGSGKAGTRGSLFLSAFALSLLLLEGIFPIACGSNNSPTSPPAPTPVPTVTLYWAQAYWTEFQNEPAGNFVELDLQVNGKPSTAAGVTVTGGGVTLSLPYDFPVTDGGLVCSRYALSPAVPNFTGGVSYIFSTTAGGQTAAATLGAPGPFVVVTDTTSPYSGAVTSVSWSGDFSESCVSLQETGPVTGPSNYTCFLPGTNSVALPTGVAATVLGYSAGASVYSFAPLIWNEVPGPSGTNVQMANFFNSPLSQSLTLH